MMKRGFKLLAVLLIVFAIIVIGDDETREYVKQMYHKLLNRGKEIVG